MYCISGVLWQSPYNKSATHFLYYALIALLSWSLRIANPKAELPVSGLESLPQDCVSINSVNQSRLCASHFVFWLVSEREGFSIWIIDTWNSHMYGCRITTAHALQWSGMKVWCNRWQVRNVAKCKYCEINFSSV